MSLTLCFLEDFRLAPAIQVRHYTPEEQACRPHLPGFALTQLLDQMAGHELNTKNCQFLICAPAATAYWLASAFNPNNIHLRLITEAATSQLQYCLSRFCCSSVKNNELFYGLNFQSITCTVIAGYPAQLLADYAAWQAVSGLNKKPLLIYDSNKLLAKQAGGKHFLNSSIWASRIT